MAQPIINHDFTDFPGTVQLIDAGHNSTAKHASGDKDIILVPTPSNDPEDPLNWSCRRKLLATSCVAVYTLMVTLPSSAVYSVVGPISKQTNLSVHDLISGTGAMFLLAGWGCIPLQALALQYGKRPMYLASLIGLTIVMATAPLCTSPGPYYANKIIQGLVTAPVESLCEITIADIWFAHQRPRYMAVYGFTLAGAGKLAPTLAGLINYYQSWQWTLYWSAIGSAVALVYCFFLMEETNYDRVQRPAEEQAVPKVHGHSETQFSSPIQEKTAAPVDTAEVEFGTAMYTKKSYRQKLSLLDKKRPNRMVDVMLGPLKFFRYPVVVYAGLMYGANGLVWSGILNATAGITYGTQYGFDTRQIAYAYLGGVVGVVVGSVYCGKVGEWVTIRLARRNKGISEPEHILWIFLASFICVPSSLLLWGVGATYHVHWFGLVFAQFFLSVSNAIAAPVALTYAISAYRDMSGELVTTAVIIRNTMSFAISYGINPWVEAQGFRDCFITAACIAVVFNGSMFLMIKYGKALRHMSAPRYWSAVEHARSKGLGH